MGAIGEREVCQMISQTKGVNDGSFTDQEPLAGYRLGSFMPLQERCPIHMSTAAIYSSQETGNKMFTQSAVQYWYVQNQIARMK